jgi:WD40 repeat protein
MRGLNKFVGLVGHSGVVGSMSAHGDRFVTGANRHQAVESCCRIWDFAGSLIGEINTSLNSIFGLAISPDGCFVAAGGGGAVFGTQWEYTGGVEVWSLEKQQKVAQFGKNELFFTKSISFSPDGQQVLTSNLGKPSGGRVGDRKRLALWRTANYKKVLAFGEHDSGIESACFAPNGQFVAFGANPAAVGQGAPSHLLPSFRHQGFVARLLRKKTDVKLFNVNSVTPVIRIWDSLSHREREPLDLPMGRIERLAFSPDGRTVASSGSGLFTWDFESRNLITEFAQGAYSRCLAFSPNGEILASGGGYRSEPGGPYEDCGIKLWDSKTARLIAFLPHQRPVHSLAFSPDGARIAAGGEIGELLLWNLESI